MQDRFVAAAALVVVAGVAGCSSSSKSPPPPPGSLPPVTAHITINGQDAGTAHFIDCGQLQHYFTIKTGDQAAGVTAVVESIEGGDKVAAKSVEITNMGGFTGSFWQGLAGNADAKVSGNTYTINGTATGFNTDNPNKQATATFQIKAAC